MRLRLTRPARHDIAAILDHNHATFGPAARQRHEAPIDRAPRAITAPRDPPGSRAADAIGSGPRLYHLRLAPRSTDPPDVRRPRHLVAYRRLDPDLVLVLRVLHDAMDLPSHLQDEP